METLAAQLKGYQGVGPEAVAALQREHTALVADKVRWCLDFRSVMWGGIVVGEGGRVARGQLEPPLARGPGGKGHEDKLLQREPVDLLGI